MAGKVDKKANNWRKARLLATIFIIGFILNIIWENAQAPLYKGYTGFREHFMICFWASLVDVVVILVLATLVSVWRNGFKWIVDLGWKEVLVLMILGGAVAVVFECWALEYEVWEYTNKMPIVPHLHIGILPLLQMMVLPPFTFYITGMIFKAKQPKMHAK